MSKEFDKWWEQWDGYCPDGHHAERRRDVAEVAWNASRRDGPQILLPATPEEWRAILAVARESLRTLILRGAIDGNATAVAEKLGGFDLTLRRLLSDLADATGEQA